MVRVFSVRRVLLSCVLGFLVPLSYAFMLSTVYDYAQRPTPQFLAWPFGWPRPLWVLAMGREPTEADLWHGVIFIAVCNTLLYGVVVYAALTVLSMLRRGGADFEPPPPPERLDSAAP